MYIRIYFFIGLLLLTPAIGAKSTISHASNVPGGIVIKAVPCNAKVYFNNTRCMVKKVHQRCRAIVGIPLTTKPGTRNLIIKTRYTNTTLPITIKYKKYPAERFNIPQEKYIKISAKNMQRIKRESKLKQAIVQHWSDKMYANLNFIIPVPGRIVSPFGTRRIINRKIKSRHKGIDIAAKSGTPIKAPAAGYVVNTANYFYGGKVIFIDHGQSLITIYSHLSKILVKPYQFVQRGQVIGLVGSTGRSTGPHLHWGVVLNGARVNPLLFL